MERNYTQISTAQNLQSEEVKRCLALQQHRAGCSSDRGYTSLQTRKNFCPCQTKFTFAQAQSSHRQPRGQHGGQAAVPPAGTLLPPAPPPQGHPLGLGTGHLPWDTGTGSRQSPPCTRNSVSNTSAVKILHVPQLIIAINYLYRYSHLYKEGRIIINNALARREQRLFYYLL